MDSTNLILQESVTIKLVIYNEDLRRIDSKSVSFTEWVLTGRSLTGDQGQDVSPVPECSCLVLLYIRTSLSLPASGVSPNLGRTYVSGREVCVLERGIHRTFYSVQDLQEPRVGSRGRVQDTSTPVQGKRATWSRRFRYFTLLSPSLPPKRSTRIALGTGTPVSSVTLIILSPRFRKGFPSRRLWVHFDSRCLRSRTSRFGSRTSPFGFRSYWLPRSYAR